MIYGALRRGVIGAYARGVVKYSDFGHIKGYISRKRCKTGGKLVLITNRKSYMNFRLVPKSVTLTDLERRNGPYFALFHRIRVRCRRNKSSRSLSYLLMCPAAKRPFVQHCQQSNADQRHCECPPSTLCSSVMHRKRATFRVLRGYG